MGCWAGAFMAATQGGIYHICTKESSKETLTLWEILQPERHFRVWQGSFEQDGEDGDARREEAEAAHHFCEHSGREVREDVSLEQVNFRRIQPHLRTTAE